MQPSSILCRAQEALQRSRAAAATLDNVRSQATKAADAWAKEAVDAELREKRLAHSRAVADKAADRRAALLPRPVDRASGENPDRGFADCETIGD